VLRDSLDDRSAPVRDRDVAHFPRARRHAGATDVDAEDRQPVSVRRGRQERCDDRSQKDG
jgi:hypothetical protein